MTGGPKSKPTIKSYKRQAAAGIQPRQWAEILVGEKHAVSNGSKAAVKEVTDRGRTISAGV
jgi:hypothetical protein